MTVKIVDRSDATCYFPGIGPLSRFRTMADVRGAVHPRLMFGHARFGFNCLRATLRIMQRSDDGTTVCYH